MKITKICKLEGCNNKVKVSRNNYCSKKCYSKTLIGHTFNRGKKRTEEQKKKYSEANKGKKQSPEAKQKQIEAQMGHIISEETRQKIRESNLGKKTSDGAKKKQSESKIIFYANGGKVWNVGLTKESDIRLKFYGEKVSKKLKGRKNPKHSIRMKGLWKDEDFNKKQKESRNLFPNKAELYLQDIINSIFPNKFQYVGDYSMFIGGKCPDFIDKTNNKIIELYGDYWHQNEDPNDRINYFKQYGYDTLVIWGSELKDINNLKEKLGVFYNGLHRL